MDNFDIQYIINLFSILLKYIHVTLSISLLSMIIGITLAILLALIKIYKIKGLYFFTNVYISFFRGTPFIAQLFLLYFGLPEIIPVLKNLNAYNAAVICLALNASAYMAESIRAAITSIEKGQTEAALSLGMTNLQALKLIIIPQSARIAIPSLANNFIDIIKGSSLAFTIGVAEIMGKAQMEGSASYKLFESYLAVALLYWVIVLVFEYLQRNVEYKINKAY